ncbi:MAG TPA: bifunctional diaminohydroxyphosphoribosylaminopyrimidine deaminase/5-amino-6-(5-phosphoribosylamino)uracil reductase RibD [Xanthobacteraceae bacterium]|nr:bifunctional diaminohydroxyphosphoribosylaminopyrimidine deaminase/5-amino-6-(5-phosphoribosylamino)uracil reductase RibD [Xanthobacteraceae bacterium]
MSMALRAAASPAGAETWDERLMAAALSIGRRNLGQTFPNPAVGALVVRWQGSEPIVAGRGFTARGGRPHAEAEALARAGADAKGASIYVTLEPCVPHGRGEPCTDMIIKSGISRAVIALEDPNPGTGGRGVARLREAGVAVTVGPGEAEARRAHAGHIRRMRDSRAHLILKLAVSADGKTGLAGRKPVGISCEASRAEAHMLRATSDAVLVGVGTVLADDPMLNCRLPGMADRSPIRIVLDGHLRTPLASRLVQTAREIPLWIIARPDAPLEPQRELEAAGAEVMRVSTTGGKVDLGEALFLLATREITRVLVEGGPILSAALLKANLVDEAVIVRSPKTLGDDAIPALEGMPLTALLENPRLSVIERRTLGEDTLVHLFRG